MTREPSILPPPNQLLPHAPPFLFIDEVVSLGEMSIHARRTFRPDEDFFRGHFPGNPIVPGVLLIEGMAQAFAYLMMHGRDLRGVYLTGIDRARFRRPVAPGDTVDFLIDVEGLRMGLVTGKAQARVGDQRVADARLMGAATTDAPPGSGP